MKKTDLMKLEGMTDDLATKIEELSTNEMKDMIPRSRLNEVIAERDHAKDEHASVLKQLNDLKKESGDIQSLKDKITDLQNDAKEKQKNHEAEIKQLKISNAVDAALASAKAKNVKAVKALLTDLDKAELLEDGTVKGLADQIKILQESDDSKFLFGEQGRPAGANPANNPSGGTPEGVTKEQFARMGYKERVNLFNTNKELYDQLTGHSET